MLLKNGDDKMNALPNSSICNGFDAVFSEVDSTKKLNLKNNNCLRLFYLDISNNQFTYTSLHQLLQRNIGRYVFSRASIEQFKTEWEQIVNIYQFILSTEGTEHDES